MTVSEAIKSEYACPINLTTSDEKRIQIAIDIKNIADIQNNTNFFNPLIP